MPVRLAINPITWSNDDHPSLGGEMKLARDAGFEVIERRPARA